jgi:hypothetical protein
MNKMIRECADITSGLFCLYVYIVLKYLLLIFLRGFKESNAVDHCLHSQKSLNNLSVYFVKIVMETLNYKSPLVMSVGNLP